MTENVDGRVYGGFSWESVVLVSPVFAVAGMKRQQVPQNGWMPQDGSRSLCSAQPLHNPGRSCSPDCFPQFTAWRCRVEKEKNIPGLKTAGLSPTNMKLVVE